MRSIKRKLTIAGAVLVTLPLLSACSSDSVKPNPTPPEYTGLGSGGPGDPGATRLGGSDSGTIFGIGKTEKDKDGGTGIGVSAYLWRGALETISFWPLASADPYGGVIITDWYTPPGTSGERFKATVYILSRDLRSDGVRVSIFRQVLQGGQWLDTTVSEQTVGEIENRILAAARRMRERQQANG